MSAALAVASLCGCGSLPADPPIVFVVVDTLRADHLSLYGAARPTSPALVRWAARGAVFERAFATAPWTVPSMASLLTGTLPVHHGAGHRTDKRGGFTTLDAGVTTLAERLAARGYRTAAIVNNVFLGPGFGLNRGFERYDHMPASDTSIRRADAVVDLALASLRESTAPQFLLVHLMDPHIAYDPAASVRGRFTGGLESSFALPVRNTRAIRKQGMPSPADRAFLRAAYDEEILAVDRALDRLLAELEGGLLRDALVILTSDHGEEFFEHGGFEHGHTLYQELLHVPFVVWGPGVVPGRYLEPASLVDAAPTALEAVGAPRLEAAQGRSLWPLLTRGAELAPRDLFAEGMLYGAERRAIVRWPYKLDTRVNSRGVRLFDLESDPGERVDLAGQRPELARELRRSLQVLRVLGEDAREPERVPLDAETRERLIGLGYLE